MRVTTNSCGPVQRVGTKNAVAYLENAKLDQGEKSWVWSF